MGTVAFDVDGTLIDFDDNPREDIIKKLRTHYFEGDIVYVWSGGGIDYAQRVVDRLHLDRYVHRVIAKAIYPVKPDISYDDMQVKLGKKNICVGSGEAEERWGRATPSELDG